MALPLRAGVVGTGVFGGYHAQKWAALEGVTLAAVFDVHPERAAELAGKFGASGGADQMAFLASVDIVSIAAPATAHADWAVAALQAGKPVYVEKPLATDLEGAQRILDAAAKAGAPVACGFLERAAFKALGLPSPPHRPVRIEAVRKGRSARNLDVSVVLDLMVHDLDLALSLTPAEPFAVEAEGSRIEHELVDEARAEASFEDGLIATFSASRVAGTPERHMRLVFQSGEVAIDFLTGEVRDTTGFGLDVGFARKPLAQDRLAASLGAFLACVRGEADAPLASGLDGMRALDLALAVERAIGESSSGF
jgi:predicted dehydrogenase